MPVGALTPRERVAGALAGRATDRLPRGELCFDDPVVRQELGCQAVAFPERLAFVSRLGLDIVTLAPAYGGGRTIPDPGCAIPDLERWARESDLFTMALIDGPFEWGMRSLGMADFLTLPATSPESLGGLVERVHRLNLQLIDLAAGQGADGIILADDIAYQQGTFINPQVLRQYFFPALAAELQAARRQGLKVFFHSDGNLKAVLSDLTEMGFQGLVCLERQAGMQLEWLLKEYGQLTCWGMLDMEHLRQAHDQAALQQLCSELQGLAGSGRVILGTTSGLFQGIDLEGLKLIYGSL